MLSPPNFSSAHLARVNATIASANDLNCGAPVAPTTNGPSALSTVLSQVPSTLFGRTAPTANPPATVDGIDIVADHVTLLLNGHTISGDGNNTAIGISVGVFLGDQGNSHVAINGPGTITGFFLGVAFNLTSHSSVKDVTLIGAGAEEFLSFGIVTIGGSNANCSDPTTCPSFNHFEGNNASGYFAGFLAVGNGNTFRDNTASNNLDGILIGGTSNDVRFNTANNNFDVGIGIGFIENSTNNSIFLNTALNNGNFDLADTNANCDSNTWKHNTFGTANETCIH